MQRIAKTSPGVLDLSAVKDEFGVPVTLNGISHRDVPDHELDNPVLQRVLGMQWVTVSKVPVETSDEAASKPSSGPASDVSPLDPVPDEPPSSDPGIVTEPEPSTVVVESTSANGNSDTQGDSQSATTASVIDVAPSPTIKAERKSSRRP